MIEAITYQSMLDCMRECQSNKDVVGILITRPDLSTGKEILANLNYFHHSSGKCSNFYVPGYGAYWYGTYPDERVVTTINGIEWSFSDKLFFEFINELQAHSEWVYFGESELLIIEYENGKLSFDKMLRFYLDDMLRDNIISSISSFFSQMFNI